MSPTSGNMVIMTLDAVFGNKGYIVTLLGGIAVIVRIVWNSRVPMRKIKVDADQKMIDNLLTRVQKLEGDNETIRKDYESRITAIHADNEAREATNDAREAVLRHELANTRTCFNALLLLLKRMPNPPAELAGIIQDIEMMKAEYARGEELERLTLRQAKEPSLIVEKIP